MRKGDTGWEYEERTGFPLLASVGLMNKITFCLSGEHMQFVQIIVIVSFQQINRFAIVGRSR